mgnify:CR=1 FL=1
MLLFEKCKFNLRNNNYFLTIVSYFFVVVGFGLNSFHHIVFNDIWNISDHNSSACAIDEVESVVFDSICGITCISVIDRFSYEYILIYFECVALWCECCNITVATDATCCNCTTAKAAESDSEYK